MKFVMPLFAASLLMWPPFACGQYYPPEYEEFLKQPSTYSRDAETRAYVRGAIDAIRLTTYCSDESFRSVDAAFLELIAYGQTTDGQATAMSNWNGIRETIGSALLGIAKRKGCGLGPKWK